jgi:DME family drug/metabolite transporter
MLELLLPFVPALVWGFTPIFYRSYISRIGPLRVNFLRTVFASAALLIPFLLYGYNDSIIFGSVSGLLTIALGDSLFFVSIGMVGASVATPLLYIQTVLIELFATFVGEPLSPLRLSSALLIIAGVYLLSRGGDSSIRLRGVAVGLAAALLEAVGQTSVKLATLAEINPLSIAFSRTITAMLALGIITAWRGSRVPCGPSLRIADYVRLALVSLCDIVIGASIYIHAVGVTGIVYPTIILGLSPLVAHIGSKGLRKESPRTTDFIAGAIIVVAIVLTVA